MTVIYIPPSLEHRVWHSEKAERVFEEAARRQGIPLLTGDEIAALYVPGTDEEEAEFDRIIREEFTTEP